MDYTEEQISKIVNNYKKNREYQKNYYKEKYKNDPEYREKAKQLSRDYYYKNSQKKKLVYHQNKEYLQAKRKLRYWENKNDVETFKQKYPEEWNKYFNQTEQ